MKGQCLLLQASWIPFWERAGCLSQSKGGKYLHQRDDCLSSFWVRKNFSRAQGRGEIGRPSKAFWLFSLSQLEELAKQFKHSRLTDQHQSWEEIPLAWGSEHSIAKCFSYPWRRHHLPSILAFKGSQISLSDAPWGCVTKITCSCFPGKQGLWARWSHKWT